MTDLVVATPVFLDLTFVGLESLPALGEERFAAELLRSPGGGAITAVGAARLGLDAAVAAPLGDDVGGDLVRGMLGEEGVRCIATRPAPRTPTTMVMPFGGDRAMVTIDPGARASAADVAALAPRAVAASLDQLYVVPDMSTAYVTCGDDDLRAYEGRPPAALEGARALFVNQREALGLSGTDTVADAAASLAERVETVVVTLAAEGAIGGDERLDDPRAGREDRPSRRHDGRGRPPRRRLHLGRPARRRARGAAALGGALRRSGGVRPDGGGRRRRPGDAASRGRGARAHAATARDRRLSASPVAGSKKWSRRWSTASSRSSPGRDAAPAVDRCAEAGAAVVGQERGVVVGCGLDRGARGVRLHARRLDREEHVRDAAELLDEVGPDDDARLSRRRRRARAGCRSGGSRGSPRARPASSGTSGASGRVMPANATLPSPTVASTTFIDGEPMNAATKRFVGSSNSRCGVSHCCSTPSRSTATRWPSVIASTWSWVT